MLIAKIRLASIFYLLFYYILDNYTRQKNCFSGFGIKWEGYARLKKKKDCRNEWITAIIIYAFHTPMQSCTS
jgi:hypothetical protein